MASTAPPGPPNYAQTSAARQHVEWFLSMSDRENIRRWRGIDHTIRSRRSITTRILNPFWEWCTHFVPPTVAPNLLSLAGTTCILQAYYTTYFYYNDDPSMATATAMFLIFAYMTLDGMDGKHARRLRQQSPIGELWSNALDNVGSVFLVLTMLSVLGVHNGSDTAWYIVQIVQLIFMREKMRAWMNPDGQNSYGLVNGPGEALAMLLAILGVRLMFGLDYLYETYVTAMRKVVIPYVVDHFVHTKVWDDADPEAIMKETVRWTYFGVSGLVLYMALQLGKERSRFALIICICYRMIPAVMIWFAGVSEADPSRETTLQSVICDGLFLSVLTTDIIVAKMAKRRIHPWVVIMCMASVFNYFTILALVAFYYLSIFAELCTYLNMPLLTINTNVYCDGVFDLCHKGHKNLFDAALKFGNRLHVGVMSDKDCAQYKRVPIMSQQERVNEVDTAKAVFMAIVTPDDYSKTGLTREFIEEHNIHIVAHGWEYDIANPAFQERLKKGTAPDYYKVPREMGICRVLPRTDGISTSDLIRRIVNRAAEFA